MLKPTGLSMDAGMHRDSCRVSSARSRNGRLQSVVSYCTTGAISSSSFVVTGVETSWHQSFIPTVVPFLSTLPSLF